ncbi:MAG: cobalamin biosynthesis protein [Acaryochloridaceae cyanobacterium SU_2_1]|nr:cobalamin biosynthesis protein [Acaryochloridaceae cyanobacterium SU_2_1]
MFADQRQHSEVASNSRVLWVGIGYQCGVSGQLLAQAIEAVFLAHHLDWGAIAGIATLDRKAEDPELLQLCQSQKWPLCLLSSTELQAVRVPTPSVGVEVAVGSPSVAEAAALQAAFQRDQSLSSVQPTLVVAKQIVRPFGQTKAITVAVAQA